MTDINVPPAHAEGKQPVVFQRNGRIYASSRDVAVCFEKRHSDVLRAIEGLGCSRDFTERNFAFSTYTDSTGRSLPCCDMTKDGFAFLVMGFTGSKTAEFKERYIDRFNAMESALKGQATALPDLSDPLVLQHLLADHLSKRIEAERRAVEAEKVAEAATETVAAFDRIANADGNVNMTLAAKALQVSPHWFMKWCDTNGWTYKRGNQRMAYQDKVNTGYLYMKTDTVERPDGSDKAVYQVFITPKGLTKLAKLLGGSGGAPATLPLLRPNGLGGSSVHHAPAME
ncbi:MAG: Rha family transcriptional regulator [Alphaproteobacteria bacterium]